MGSDKHWLRCNLRPNYTCFFDPKDYYISLVPSFYLFEDYSERMGAIPVFVELKEEDNFALTNEKIIELKVQIVKYKPKIVWIANPNNPTGNVISEETLEEIVSLAKEHNTFVVIDEAYIEYLEKIGKRSMIKLTGMYDNMMVLRTFSKAYGLAGMRIGYLISSSKDIVEAMLMLRTHFPVTQLALNMASLALSDKDFLRYTQKATQELAYKLFYKLDKLKSFRYISTATNIFLLGNNYLSDKELDSKFKEKGIITSYVNFPQKKNNRFLRITLRCEKENEYLYKTCKKIDSEYPPQQTYQDGVSLAKGQHA
ncbi:MAG: histidinol-phosphate aminotransferase family protein [Cyclobacteriaceae bacterium]|nr:histidinol-phosphate aminotransferase family protein [Cyclobacteriaceae bacterium]